MEKQLAELCETMLRVDKRQQQMMDFLQDYLPSTKTDSLAPPLKPRSRSKTDECKKIKLKRKKLKKKLPEYLTRDETMEALDIKKSNFYRNVYKILLFPVHPMGKQPYYRRSEVIELAIKVTHEPGAHTFAKLKKKQEGKGEK